MPPTIINNSAPVGTTDWFQGNPGVFSAQSGAANSYVAANFEAADFGGNISDWLISPELTFHNTDTISFWARTESGSAFPDRLELRLSLSGASNASSLAPNTLCFELMVWSMRISN